MVRSYCDSCEVIAINGVNTHEIGCPDAWRDYSRECLECGSEFIPETQYQKCCDDSCAAYNIGLPYEDDDFEDEYEEEIG